MGSGSTSGWTDLGLEVISCWTTSNWESTCCWTTWVTISLDSVLVSLGNCGDSTSVTDVRVTVGVTGVTIFTNIGVSGHSDEEPEACEVLDQVKWDLFNHIGVASAGKGGLLATLYERQGKGWFSSTIVDWFYYKKEINKRGKLGEKVYQATVNYRIPPREPRSMGRQSPQMLCSVYHSVQVF